MLLLSAFHPQGHKGTKSPKSQAIQLRLKPKLWLWKLYSSLFFFLCILQNNCIKFIERKKSKMCLKNKVKYLSTGIENSPSSQGFQTLSSIVTSMHSESLCIFHRMGSKWRTGERWTACSLAPALRASPYRGSNSKYSALCTPGWWLRCVYTCEPAGLLGRNFFSEDLVLVLTYDFVSRSWTLKMDEWNPESIINHNHSQQL